MKENSTKQELGDDRRKWLHRAMIGIPVGALVLSSLQNIKEAYALPTLTIGATNTQSSGTNTVVNLTSGYAWQMTGNYSGIGPGLFSVQNSSTSIAAIYGSGTPGVMGKTSVNNGIGVFGNFFREEFSTATGTGVKGQANYGTGVNGVVTTSGNGVIGSTQDDNGYGVYGINEGGGIGVGGWSIGSTGIGIVGVGSTADGYFQNKVGIGISPPARALHLQGSNACFRMDRDVNSSAFILVRTASGDFNTVWKTFYVGVDASGVNNGEFFIGDAGNQVSGASTKRLWITNSGVVQIPNLGTGDITFANGVVATEEGSGLAFKNDAREKIAVLDREGNFHIKGKVMEDL